MLVFSGSSNPNLTKSIADKAHLQYGESECSTFPNGERRVWIKSPVSGEDVILVQSCSQPVDIHIIETALLVDALSRAGARTITLVIPWLGYSLQDKVFRSGEPLAIEVIARILSFGVHKMIFMDLHHEDILSFFPSSSMLSPHELFVQDARKHKNSIVVAPDAGGLQRSQGYAQTLNLGLATIDKSRDLKTGKVAVGGLKGEVEGKICLIFDDIISTGSTVIEAAKLLKSRGAVQVIVYATHGLFADDAQQKLQESLIDEVIVTDTIPQDNLHHSKCRVISIASVFASALKDE